MAPVQLQYKCHINHHNLHILQVTYQLVAKKEGVKFKVCLWDTLLSLCIKDHQHCDSHKRW